MLLDAICRIRWSCVPRDSARPRNKGQVDITAARRVAPHRRRSTIMASFMASVIVFSAIAWASEEGPALPPVDSSLLERSEQELVQLDVSVVPRNKSADLWLPDLDTSDFQVLIGGRIVELRYADRICMGPTTRSELETARGRNTEPVVEEPMVPTPRTTYFFYFEQKLLTMEGLNNALEMAERLIPKLIVGGHRGMVISSGGRLLQTEISQDPQELLGMIQRIREEPRQWSEYAYAELETQRYADVGRARRSGRSLARHYQLEERSITNNRLRRFAAILGTLADVDPPKVVVQFADILRSNAGAHYLRLFPGHYKTDPAFNAYRTFSAQHAFDDVLKQAGAHGVRVYTVHAQGLAHAGLDSTRRVQDAESTQRSLALETGGAFFRGGRGDGPTSRILRRLESDLGCFYLLSFAPADLPRDKALSVVVRFSPDSPQRSQLDKAFRLRARGRIAVQSTTARRTSLLMAAHAAAHAVESEPARITVIPLGYENGSFGGLVQTMVMTPTLHAELAGKASWDLGISHIANDKVRNSIAVNAEVSDSRVPVILETVWRFKQPSAELQAVGYEHSIGQLVTGTLVWEWPDLRAHEASVSPIAVVQPMDGIFLREDTAGNETRRTSGSLGIGKGLAFTDRPTFLVGLVCRSSRLTGPLWIKRMLVGEAEVDFSPQQWDYDGERCVQIRDLIEGGVLGRGDFEYRLQVYGDADFIGDPISEASRRFTTVDADAAPETSTIFLH